MQAHTQQIRPIFEAVAAAMQYPDDSPAVEPSSEPEKSDWEETVDVLTERRQELLVLFKNVAKLSPEATVAFLNARLQAALAPGAGFAVRSPPALRLTKWTWCLPLVSNIWTELH